MGEKILEFIATFWDYLKFWWVIEQYNKGILLRWGKFVKILEPGLKFKFPFADYVFETSIVPTTMQLPSQSLPTKDEKDIVIQAIVKYRISDVKTFLLEVNDAVDAIGDMTQAIIKTVIAERDWSECKSEEIDNLITKKARVESKKWGIEILQVTITNLGKIKSIRLISGDMILT